MKLATWPKEFEKALPILEKITQAGYEAYFVGGSVRDVLLGEPIHDIDIATSATPLEVAALFPKTFDLGIQHGTIAVLDRGETYEITTFRTESGYEDFRRPDKVTFVRSLKEDLKRRDFTINAFAVAKNREVIDLFSGMTDLEKRQIRAVGEAKERFFEDALRMMRGIRFSSHLDFQIERKTLNAITTWHPLLEKIAVERIRVELEKLLLGKNPALGLAYFLKTELYQYTPGLKNQKQGLENLKARLQEKKPFSLTAAWTLLVEELSYTQEELGNFLKSWKLSNELTNKIKKYQFFLQIRKKRSYTPLELFQLSPIEIAEIEKLRTFYHLPEETKTLLLAYEQLPIHHLEELAINGKSLLQHYQVKSGPWIGESLTFIKEGVINRVIKNNQTELLEKIEEHFQWKKHLQ